MKTDRFRATLAAMNILRGEHLPPLGRIEFVELQCQWGLYALRHRDFETSMRRLESLGVIEMEKVRGKPYVVLTQRGHRTIYSFLGFVESVLTWPRRIEQALRRLRRRTGGVHLRRRRTDRSNGAPLVDDL